MLLGGGWGWHIYCQLVERRVKVKGYFGIQAIACYCGKLDSAQPPPAG